MEQKLKKIEQKLVELETTSAQTVNAFLWFSTSYERNYVVKTLTGTSHGVGTSRHVQSNAPSFPFFSLSLLPISIGFNSHVRGRWQRSGATLFVERV